MAKTIWVAPDDGSTLKEVYDQFPLPEIAALLRTCNPDAKAGIQLVSGNNGIGVMDVPRITSDLFINRIKNWKK